MYAHMTALDQTSMKLLEILVVLVQKSMNYQKFRHFAKAQKRKSMNLPEVPVVLDQKFMNLPQILAVLAQESMK